MFQLTCKVWDTISIDEESTKLLVLKDLKSTGGMNGSPVMRITEGTTELLGIYIGYDES